MIELPFLPYVEVGGETVAAGYLNLYLCNGAVIVPVCGGSDSDADAAGDDRRRVPGPRGRAGARRGAGVRWRRAALHHPAGAGAPPRHAADERPVLIAPGPPPAVAGADPAAGAAAAAARPGPGALAPRSRRARGGARRRDPRRGRRGRADRVPAGADAVALLRDHARTARRRRVPSPRSSRTGRRSRSPRRSAAETGAYVHASLYERADGRRWARLQHRDRRRARRPAGVAHPQAAHPGHRRLLRGPLLPARSRRRRAVPADRAADAPTATRASAARRAGTSGSPSSRAPTRWPAPRC